MTDDPVDLAAELIMARIANYRGTMRHALSEFEPLEALTLLGFLGADTLARFPPDQRAEMCAALCAELCEATRETAGRPSRVSGGAGSNELP